MIYNAQNWSETLYVPDYLRKPYQHTDCVDEVKSEDDQIEEAKSDASLASNSSDKLAAMKTNHVKQKTLQAAAAPHKKHSKYMEQKKPAKKTRKRWKDSEFEFLCHLIFTHNIIEREVIFARFNQEYPGRRNYNGVCSKFNEIRNMGHEQGYIERKNGTESM